IWVQGKDYGYELPMPKSLKARENERVTQSTLPAQSQPAAETAQTKPPAETTPPVTSQTEVKPTETPQTPAAPPVETAPPVQPTAPQPDTNTADRAMTDKDAANTTPARMPDTAANWVLMLLSGGALSGAGMMLRRRIG